MDVEVLRVPIKDKPVLRNLLELYRYDYSEFDGRDIGDHGLYGYTYLDHYWTEPERHPFIVTVDGKLAGFALIRATPAADGSVAWTMAEFFILRKYRRQGVGQVVAHRLFALFPGHWEVSQEHHNLPGQAFWRKVITRYTGGAFSENRRGDPPRTVQEFHALSGVQPNRSSEAAPEPPCRKQVGTAGYP